MDARERRFSRLLRFSPLLVTAAAGLLLSACSSFTGGYGSGAGSFHTVIVDAGHGGHDRGARAVSGSPEKAVALDTARRLAKVLRQRGFRVIETRNRDYFIPLGGRTAVSNRTGGAIFVSIHYNWSSRYGARGLEIYYYSPRSKRLAANILKQTLAAYPTSNRGLKQRGFYVLRNNRRPAVLCELGFLSNPQDNRYAQSWWYRQKLAERIAAGIIAEQQGRRP